MGKTLLIADDEPWYYTLTDLFKPFTDLGCRLHIVKTIDAAESFLLAEPVDVLVLDVSMAESPIGKILSDGPQAVANSIYDDVYAGLKYYEICRERWPDLKVILASHIPASLLEGHLLAGQHVITKADATELLSAVGLALSERA